MYNITGVHTTMIYLPSEKYEHQIIIPNYLTNVYLLIMHLHE